MAIDSKFRSSTTLASLAVLIVGTAAITRGPASPVHAQATDAATQVTVFRDVLVFDGRNPRLSLPSDVIVRGPRIERIAPTGTATVSDPGVFAAAVKAGKQFPYSAHNPNFVVDLKAIPVGTKVATVSMLELMGKS